MKCVHINILFYLLVKSWSITRTSFSRETFITCRPCDHGIFYKMVWKWIDVEFVLFPSLQSNKEMWTQFLKTKQKLHWNFERWRILWRDVTIEVGEDPNVKIFRAHTVILAFLRWILINKNNNGVLAHVKLSDISLNIYQIILIPR